MGNEVLSGKLSGARSELERFKRDYIYLLCHLLDRDYLDQL